MKILSIFLLTGLLYFSDKVVALEEIPLAGSYSTASGAVATVSLIQTVLPGQTVAPSGESVLNSIEKISPICLLGFNAEPVVTLSQEDFLDYYNNSIQQFKENLFASWLEKAEQGDPSAEFCIGCFHEAGIPFGKMWDLAAQYYSRATKKGFQPAQVALLKFLEEGKASYLPVDYLKELAGQGNQAAIAALNKYSEDLSNHDEASELEYGEEKEEDSELESEEEGNEEV